MSGARDGPDLLVDEKELIRLVLSLEWTDGFGLYFIRTDTLTAEQHIADQVRSGIARQVASVFLPAAERDPWWAIVEQRDQITPDAILLIHGLTNLLSSTGDNAAAQTAAALNWRRSNYRDFAHPLVFFASDGALTTLARLAPDFFDWNSGIFDIVATANSGISSRIIEAPWPDNTTNLDVGERWRLIAELEERVAAASGLTRSSREARADAAYRLGLALAECGEPVRARAALERARDDFASTNDELGEAKATGQLAELLTIQGESDEALSLLQGEVLPAFERLGDVRSRAVTLGKVADILQARGQLDEALRIRQEEQLPVYERLGAIRDQVVCRTNIALTMVERGRDEDSQPIVEHLIWAYTTARERGFAEAATIEAILKQLFGEPEEREVTP